MSSIGSASPTRSRLMSNRGTSSRTRPTSEAK
eukprot:CAMPEP_0119090710 /NCGR_PEP_ID=MMETSP1178-20130426/153735_1 /TAXON_ID=33656 /ORGANISM="unid sp, Strain CCMP2000" /LENGTH=31 /DNA_ID= /DNA_START= /DNA_END= /DNA_ORIENTATION=